MKELRLTQEEVILMPTEDEAMHKAIMDMKFNEKGFDLTKPIQKNFDVSTKEIVYSQK